MTPFKIKKENHIIKYGLSGKLAVMVFLLGLFVYIPSILFGAYGNLKKSKNDLAAYKNRLEIRVQNIFEPVIWNYDIETLRKLISTELIDDNLKSVKVSTKEKTIIWMASENGKIIDETTAPIGTYIERRTIPIYRLDERGQIIAYATIWYDNSAGRNKFFHELKYEFLMVGGILLVITVVVNILSYIKLVRPLESIRMSMIEAGKSSFDSAKEKIESAGFRNAFPEITRMSQDLDFMFNEIDEANRKLRESEARLRAAFQQAAVGVAQVIPVTEKYMIANQKYCEIIGYSQDELRDISCRTITHEDDLEEYMAQMKRLLEGETREFTMEKRCVRKDGKIVWVDLTVSPVRVPGEQITSQIMVIQDITDRKLAEEKIRKLNDELEDKVVERTIDLENANCELEAAIEDLRAAQTQLINKEKMAVLGQLVAGIAHELNTPLGIINSAGGTLERIIQNEINELIHFSQTTPKDAFEVYKELIEKSINSIAYQDNTYKRQMRRKYFNVVEENNLNISDEIIEKLVDMGYDNETDEFIKLVIKPENLEAITNAYNMSTMYKSTNMIKISAEKASKVIAALKTYSHKDYNEEAVPHDVIQDIEMVLTLYYNQVKYGVEIIRSYEDVPPIICFPDKLHQVWVNIINNALQAMDYKGTLKISISNVDSRVKVSITDSGSGISDSIIDRIFEPFFSTKRLGEGTGLGLDIVKRIIDEIGGSIDVKSKPGETTFNVWLKT